MQQLHSTNNTKSARKKLRSALAVALGFSALLSSMEVNACAACGCTLSKDWESQGISGKPGFTVDISYDYLNQNKQRYGTSSASSSLVNSQYAAGQEVEAYTKTNTISASLIYNADTWGVSVMVPYVNRNHGTYGQLDTPTPGATVDTTTLAGTSSNSGIGDVRIIGRYNGFSEDKSSGLIVGIKLPTGSTSNTFSDGTALDAGLQIGTGSTDIILGGYTTGTLDTYGWFLQGTVQHAVATKSLGGADYRPGDAYSLNTGIRYAGFGAKVSPMLQFNIIKRQADTDNGTGINVPVDPVTGAPVSGGTLAYLAPGISVRVGGGASVYGFVQIPIYRNVNSLQLTPSYTVSIGVRQSF
jgi:hypothetical protein